MAVDMVHAKSFHSFHFIPPITRRRSSSQLNFMDFCPTTVDGRHPAPVDRSFFPLFASGSIHSRWLALGILNHQQYVTSIFSPIFCFVYQNRSLQWIQPSVVAANFQSGNKRCDAWIFRDEMGRQFDTGSHTIHGTNGLFTYMNGWFLWFSCRYTTCKWHRIRWSIPQIPLVLRHPKLIFFLMIDHDRT